MVTKTHKTLDDLHQLIGDIEGLFKGSAENAGEYAGEAGERICEGLASARERIADVEQSLRGGVKRGARTVNRYVHDSPWQSIGIASAAAFILGTLISRRD
jgi:ElaB/YqjD/DUF883 family membrane-anchored ribosome-binding protein